MKFIQAFLRFWFVTVRIVKYRWLSDCDRAFGRPNCYHPLLLKGKGTIRFGRNVQIGVIASERYYDGYAYVEARESQSEITFGNEVAINNNFSATACGRITIADHVLIGTNCLIMDNDGHPLDPEKRNQPVTDIRSVSICENVFIGDNVTILKGVTIGKNSVIGSGSVVTKDVPENVIAAGNPAFVIKSL